MRIAAKKTVFLTKMKKIRRNAIQVVASPFMTPRESGLSGNTAISGNGQWYGRPGVNMSEGIHRGESLKEKFLRNMIGRKYSQTSSILSGIGSPSSVNRYQDQIYQSSPGKNTYAMNSVCSIQVESIYSQASHNKHETCTACPTACKQPTVNRNSLNSSVELSPRPNKRSTISGPLVSSLRRSSQFFNTVKNKMSLTKKYKSSEPIEPINQTDIQIICNDATPSVSLNSDDSYELSDAIKQIKTDFTKSELNLFNEEADFSDSSPTLGNRYGHHVNNQVQKRYRKDIQRCSGRNNSVDTPVSGTPVNFQKSPFRKKGSLTEHLMNIYKNLSLKKYAQEVDTFDDSSANPDKRDDRFFRSPAVSHLSIRDIDEIILPYNHCDGTHNFCVFRALTAIDNPILRCSLALIVSAKYNRALTTPNCSSAKSTRQISESSYYGDFSRSPSFKSRQCSINVSGSTLNIPQFGVASPVRVSLSSRVSPSITGARSLRDGGSTQISSRLGTSSGATDSTDESKNQCIVNQNNHQEKTPKKMIRRPTLNKRISRSMTNDINKLGRTTSRAQKISSRTTSNTNLLMIPDRFAGMLE